jgi:Cu(I)/Ag(I) efflux system membrane fusion protein
MERMMSETKHEWPIDEGGLRAPPHLKGWRKWWWWFDFIILVKLARLRFIGILALIGIIITQWDLLVSYYDKWTRPAVAGDAAGSDVEWFCPMHPAVVRDNSKDKCPVCFMPLSKRKKGDGTVEALPAGVVSRVQLSPYRVVLAGVQTWEVSYVSLTKEIAAVGYVEFNESGQRSISARFAARVDKLFVSQTGRMVKEGDELASMYSPELVVAMKSLLDAKKSGNQSLLNGTQTRLQLLGISDDQITEILTTGTANTHLKIRSPINGHVIKKYIREGQYVTEGMPLFDVVDLNTVWIQAQVYEDDLLFLPEALTQHESGDVVAETLPVTATTKALPNEEFHGMLTFVYPHVDQQTRTVTVRFELDNPKHKLRPGSTATVTLKVPPERWALLSGLSESDVERRERLKLGELLAVPQSAVIDTGSQKIVYREAEPSVFEGVLVKLGPKMSGPEGVAFFPVLEGLEPGTQVVTSGSFLVDAETRLNPSAGSIYFGGSGGSGGKSSVTTVRPTTPDDPDAKLTAALAKLSPEDRKAVDSQRFCPVLTQNRLGSMGAPVKLTVGGESVYLCCAACKENALTDPTATLKKIKELRERKTPVAPANVTAKEEQEIKDALAELTPADRKLAESQRFCAVLGDSRLGSMGPPMKLMIDGQPVFLCCEGCQGKATANKLATLQKVQQLQSPKPASPDTKPAAAEKKIEAALAKLSPEDRKAVDSQRFCPVLEKSRLGSMGAPVKLMIDGQAVFLCCSSCRETALKNPQQTLTKAKTLTGGRRD